MGVVIFVPGLQGKKALENPSHIVGPNEQAVRDAAFTNGWMFKKAAYQFHDDQTPTLNRMGFLAERSISEAIQNTNEPAIIVGSSVGFGVALNALSRLHSTTSPLGLIGFKPVPDPLMAIELQINNPSLVANLKKGITAEIPLPVENIHLGELKDSFALTGRHLRDKLAVRLLSSDPSAVMAFNKAVNGKVVESVVVYGISDNLTPTAHMKAFRDAFHSTQTELVQRDGNHTSDLTKELKVQVCEMIARLG